MEPRSIERGNPAVSVANIPSRLASMEPRSIERGNGLPLVVVFDPRRSASMEPRSIERGNAKRAGKSGKPQKASMEPRSIERGNCRLIQLRESKGVCFNGATLN